MLDMNIRREPQRRDRRQSYDLQSVNLLLEDPEQTHTESNSLSQKRVADQISAVLKRHDVPSRETPLHLAVSLDDLFATKACRHVSNASEPVVDADGDLISDGSYYAVPVSPTMTNLNIEMNVPSTICGQSSYCWLTETHGKGLLFIAAGPKPETGKDSSKSFFQIKKAGDFLRGYKFVYCRNDKSCYEFGMVVDRFGYNRLAPANLPFLVDFVKADKTETSSKSKTDSFVKDYKEFVELEDKSFNLHNS
ncbi:unnamed protein product, partial [Brassica oleracea var. botrytis]